jgi:hypothetical protein
LTCMKKLLLLILIFYSCKTFAQSPVQNNTAFSLGGELGIPSYGLYNIGTGVSAKLEIPVISPVSVSLTGGFSSIFYKSSILYDYRNSGGDLFAPLKAGLKYYPAQNVYLEGEGGVAFELNHGQRDLAAFSIGAGFIVPSGENHGLDIGFRYEDWQGQVKQTALRVAYRFGK